MTFLVRDILPYVATYLGGAGVSVDCPDGEEQALRAYNDMTRRLMLEGDWDGCSAVVRLPVHDGTVTLNRRFDAIIAYTAGGVPSAAVPRDFEFIQAAVGGFESSGLIDIGDRFPLMRDLSRPMNLMAVSERPERDSRIFFSGIDHLGRDYRASDLLVNFMGQAPEFTSGDQFHPGIFRSVTAIRKTRTAGYVHVYGWDPQHMREQWLSTLAPDEVSPALRRYRLGDGVCHDGSIKALVSLRWVPLYSLDDVSLIQLPEAFVSMALAMNHFGKSELQLYKGFLGEARRLLGLQVRRSEKGMKQVLNVVRTRQPRRRIGRGFRP